MYSKWHAMFKDVSNSLCVLNAAIAPAGGNALSTRAGSLQVGPERQCLSCPPAGQRPWSATVPSVSGSLQPAADKFRTRLPDRRLRAEEDRARRGEGRRASPSRRRSAVAAWLPGGRRRDGTEVAACSGLRLRLALGLVTSSVTSLGVGMSAFHYSGRHGDRGGGGGGGGGDDAEVDATAKYWERRRKNNCVIRRGETFETSNFEDRGDELVETATETNTETVGATAARDPWDASPRTSEIVATNCIRSPPTFATSCHFC